MDVPCTGQSPRLSVVIPAMNEAANIGHVLRTLPDDVFEVILVDGRSTDGTVEAARAVRGDIRVVQQAASGKGDALAAGFAACRGDVVVMHDADGSADGAEIPRFVEALVGGADLVKGSRFLNGGGSTDLSPLRRMGNRVFCGMVNGLFGTRYSDLCYGYNAAWLRQLKELALDCNGFEVETVLSIRSATAGLSVAEVPSMEAARLNGKSNLRTFRDGFRVLRAIVREWAASSVARADGSATVEPVRDPVSP